MSPPFTLCLRCLLTAFAVPVLISLRRRFSFMNWSNWQLNSLLAQVPRFTITKYSSQETSASSPESPTSPSESGDSLSRHQHYYLQDDMAIFLVEQRLFKVHRHFLIRESDIFRWMFMCPPPADGPDGGTDDKAIPLPDVTFKEFESLLHFFYDGSLLATSMHDDRRMLLNEWLDLLSIATRFDFEKIRQRAIREIDSGGRPLQTKVLVDADGGLLPAAPAPSQWRLDPVEKILLAEKYDIPEWLAPSYAALCQRAHPLEEWEGEKLGMKTALRIARAREAVREHETGSDPNVLFPTPILEFVEGEEPVYAPYPTSHVINIVQEVFWPTQPS